MTDAEAAKPEVTEPYTTRLREIESRLFFIVGAERSGTTLLQSILVSAPGMHIPPETKFYGIYKTQKWLWGNLKKDRNIRRVIRKACQHQRHWGVIFDEEIFGRYVMAAPRTADGLFLSILAASDANEPQPARFIGEKTPLHIRYVGRLREAFPQARFVHIIRDPRAVVASNLKRLPVAVGSEKVYTTREIGAHVDMWRQAVKIHHRYADRLGPQRYLLVRYENLVTDPRAAILPVCRFLDVEFTEAMLKPHNRRKRLQRDDNLSLFCNTQKPIFTDSIQKWRTELSQDQISLVEHGLRKEMKLMGYEPTGARTWLPGPRLMASSARAWTTAKSTFVLRQMRKTWRRITSPPGSARQDASGGV